MYIYTILFTSLCTMTLLLLLQTSLTITTETVSMDGVLNTVQVPPSAMPSSHQDGVAMETGSSGVGAGGDGRVVVSFVTKMDIASEGEG